MLRRAWQNAMIALARAEGVTRRVQASRVGAALARRYVAGATPEAALARASRLWDERAIRASLFYLGEYVSDPVKIAATVAAQLTIVARLAASPLDAHLSVDPTQIGQMRDPALARRNAFSVAEAIAAAPKEAPRLRAMMLDMEDASFTDATIALHDDLRAAGLPAALTLQAYLRRTEEDLKRQIERGAHVRLVKGAFVAAAATSFTGRAAIKANSRRLIDLMFSPRSRDSGFYPSIATHDDALQRYAVARAEAGGWRADQWEIEMLVGVRDDLAAALAAAGRRVRLYLPFGLDWWPYAIRRIGENPANAALLARSLIARG
jgi:proline dehydrogenase